MNLYKRNKIVISIQVGIHLCLLIAQSGWSVRTVCYRLTFGIDHRLSFVVGRTIGSSSSSGDQYHNHRRTKQLNTDDTNGSCIVVSNVLQRHRTYFNNRLPHNRILYDILQVPHNATIQQIQHSYRKLSRIYHPDKNRNKQRGIKFNDNDNTNSQPLNLEKENTSLQRIRSAYDLLSNDTKRFLYHRHGIIHSTQVDVMSILYPLQRNHPHLLTNSILSYDIVAINELHQLMGYNDHDTEPKESLRFVMTDSVNAAENTDDDDDDKKKEERIQNIMLFLIERIRPIIERSHNTPPNTSSSTTHYYEAYVYHDLIQQCDRIKILPLGPSILRCVGRAYRYEGRRILRHLQQQQQPPQPSRYSEVIDTINNRSHDNERYYHGTNDHHNQPQRQKQVVSFRQPVSQYILAMDRIRHTMRHVKHLTTAAIAGSRVFIEERSQNNKNNRQREAVILNNININDDDDINGNGVFDDPNDIVADRTNEPFNDSDDVAMLESLQIDALWKVYKIELDSIVRQACRRILASLQDPNTNLFRPSRMTDSIYTHHPNSDPSPSQRQHQHQSTSSSSSMAYDGWIVSSNTNTVDGTSLVFHPIITNTRTSNGNINQQHRVADTFIQMGKILIERSKVGTSWMQ